MVLPKITIERSTRPSLRPLIVETICLLIYTIRGLSFLSYSITVGLTSSYSMALS